MKLLSVLSSSTRVLAIGLAALVGYGYYLSWDFTAWILIGSVRVPRSVE